MISTIICNSCKKYLRHGSNTIEYKTCIECVQKIHPKANPNKIKMPLSISDHVDSIIKQNESERRKKRGIENNLDIEVSSSIVIQGNEILYTFNFIIAKIKGFDIAFTKEQLLSFIEDIDRIALEEKLN